MPGNSIPRDLLEQMKNLWGARAEKVQLNIYMDDEALQKAATTARYWDALKNWQGLHAIDIVLNLRWKPTREGLLAIIEGLPVDLQKLRLQVSCGFGRVESENIGYTLERKLQSKIPQRSTSYRATAESVRLDMGVAAARAGATNISTMEW